MENLRKFGLGVLRAQIKVLKCDYSTKSGLLSDLNVLDLSRVIAGPFCTMTLGDLGANVIKVESLDGDEARRWGPPFISENKDSYYFLSVNRNKKSICIDFKSQEGKKVLYDLARKCDVVVENFVPGKLDKLEIGYDKLSTINPKLIYCAITGFGSTGPYAKKPGYDVIAAAMGGLLNTTGERNGDPVKAGVAITDVTTGLHAFGAIMTALYFRQKTGKGQKIDCNLLSTQISSMINIATIYLNCGIEGQRWGTAHANLVPYQAFKSKDGYMVIGTGSNPQFADFCRLIGKEELITDERFKDNSNRVENRDELIRIISEEPVERVAVITLRPTRPETRKKVVWTEDTVDNEHMNKKKSKCCCIYEKPKKFGESDSEDSDDELENCSGHVEKKRGKRYHHHDHDCPHHSAEAATVTITIAEQETVTPEPTATITLQPSEATPESTETTPQAPITTPKPTEEATKATPQPSEATPTPAPAPPDKKD
ncbi:hypothetical protein B5X24_HaOG209525 [Helicoverpa armigera]|uniref:Uncharacterized protein n=1 Tax=Helicoverpa armigera TaxID=29058 RepID=A0A2W1BE09_HELAM|nr:hypothetical protein B5X24_HaOG209525 [Helicoverpa armigera]